MSRCERNLLARRRAAELEQALDGSRDAASAVEVYGWSPVCVCDRCSFHMHRTYLRVGMGVRQILSVHSYATRSPSPVWPLEDLPVARMQHPLLVMGHTDSSVINGILMERRAIRLTYAAPSVVLSEGRRVG